MTATYRIGVIPGDGIGPEVTTQALKVLNIVTELYGFHCDLASYPWSGRHYLETGELMPESVLDEYRELDALFLGALGDPRVERGLVERSVIITLRMGLDLYINLRPIVLYAEHLTPLKGVLPSDLDMVVVRENTEDVYVGMGGTLRAGTQHETAVAEMIFTRRGVERAIRYAYELARSRNKQRKLTLVDKSNAIRPQEIWRRALASIAPDYPDVTADAIYVDAAAAYMIDSPGRFDVIVTTNLFGDILTDLGAALQGGMGAAASGNIHPGKVSMFEPIHGSAPDIAGRGVANPVAAILALSMMLDYLGQGDAARAIERTVGELLVSKRIPRLDSRGGISTEEMGNLIALEIKRSAAQTIHG
ncbi:MAG: 3-isopropylmalate dehydrogenase [Chloroflexota bacterium]